MIKLNTRDQKKEPGQIMFQTTSTLAISQCIDKIILSALPAVRRATREEDDIDAKVVQMHKAGAAQVMYTYHFFLQ